MWKSSQRRRDLDGDCGVTLRGCVFASGRPVHRLGWASHAATGADRVATRVRTDSRRSGHRRNVKYRTAGVSPDIDAHGVGADPERSQARRACSVSRAPRRPRPRPPPAVRQRRPTMVLGHRKAAKVLPPRVDGAFPAMVTRVELERTNQLR